MPHSNNLISQVVLPGDNTVYEIHDKHAIHNVSELGVAGVLVFKGVLSNLDELAAMTPSADRNGHVYLVEELTATTTAGQNLIPDGRSEASLEYVCIEGPTSGTYIWEPLGTVHDAASSSHTHTYSGTASASNVTLAKQVVTGITSTTASKTVSITAGAPNLTPSTDKVLGADSVITTTISGSGLGTVTKKNVSVKRSTNVAVGADGTAQAITSITPSTGTFVTSVTSGSAKAVTGVTGATGNALTSVSANGTATAITELNTTTIKNPTVTGSNASKVTLGTSLTASKVSATKTTAAATKISSYGSAASWGASVSADGTLSFSWTANQIPSGTNVDVVTSVTAEDVSVPVISVTASNASTVTTSNVTVATSSKNTAEVLTGVTGSSSAFVTGIDVDDADFVNAVTAPTGSALTGLGTPSKDTFLKGVKVSTQPVFETEYSTTGGVSVVTDVATAALTGATTITGNVVDAVVSVTASAPSVSGTVVVNEYAATKESVTGTAAGQSFSGTTSTPKD